MARPGIGRVGRSHLRARCPVRLLGDCHHGRLGHHDAGLHLLAPDGSRRVGLSNFELPTSHRQVKTEIPIDASPSTVWQNIIRVPTIRDSEQRTISFHVLGFPKPAEATLSHEGVGGIRHASFEGGLVFVETITVWEPDRELAFGIEVDPELVPATTLDEHVVVGGPFFETLNGHYRIKPLEEGGVVLHLESTHRLSTRFNFYSSWWSDLIMRDIQNYILVILKERCEDQEQEVWTGLSG